MTKDSKPTAILEAANKQFRQYGFKKTSMEDIAKQTGISRASLYSYFNDKDDIFRAVSAKIHEHALASAESHLNATGKANNLASRIEKALLARHKPFQDAVTKSTHGSELFDEYSRLCGDIVANSNSRFQYILANTMKAAVKTGEIDLKATGVTPAAVATILNLATAGLKHGAQDNATFVKRTKGLVKIFLSGLSTP